MSIKNSWSLDPDTIYLNHGSFGPAPLVVRQTQQKLRDLLQANPMKALVRDFEPLLDNTCHKLGQLIGSSGGDLLLVDNATFAMNIVASSFPLASGDEVLLTNHEYGAVKRIWQMRAKEVGAKIVVGLLPRYLEDEEEVAQQFLSYATKNTKMIIVSAITSPTAIILPVQRICELAKQRGIAVCVDAPHAVGMLPLDLKKWDCEFVCASCHKWLSAPIGSGFLYVTKNWQHRLKPPIISWGGSLDGAPSSWKDNFQWLGSRDLSANFSIPAAIEFFEQYGWEKFRQTTHELADYAREKLIEICETELYHPNSRDWYGSMINVPLPEYVPVPEKWTGVAHPLQIALRDKHKTEVLITKWNFRMHIRVSCHLYNDREQIDVLCDSLQAELKRFQ